MSLPYNENLRPKPASCQMCNCDERCKAYNLLGQPLNIYDVANGIYAAGMYRVVCENINTGNVRDVGGVIDIGDQVLNFIPGNVMVDNTILRDPGFKKLLVVGFTVLAIISAVIILKKVFF